MVRAWDCSFFCWDSLDSLDSPKRSLPTGTSTGTVSGARVSVVVGASRRFPEVAGRTAFSQVMLLGFSMVYRVKKLNLPLELRVFMWMFRLRSFQICGSLGWFEGKSTANGFWPSLLPVIWMISGMPGDFSKLHDASLSATVGSKHSISNFRIWGGCSTCLNNHLGVSENGMAYPKNCNFTAEWWSINRFTGTLFSETLLMFWM